MRAHLATQWIERDASDDETLGTFSVVSTKQRVDPRQKNRTLEGLAQEVIGPHLEPLDLVHLAVLGGQHQEWRVDPRVSKVQADAESIAPGQHDVENDHVVVAVAAGGETTFAVVTLLDDEALVAQQVSDGAGQIVIVFDKKHSALIITHLR